jgi:hypothetical protein
VAGVSAALCLLALPQLIEIATRAGELASSGGARGATLRSAIAPFLRPAVVCAVLSGLASWAVCFAGRGRPVRDSGGSPGLVPRAGWCIVWFAAPTFSAWLLSILEVAPLSEPRYALVAAAGTMVLTGIFCATIAEARSRAMCAALLAVLAWGLFEPAPRGSEGWRSAISHINADAQARTYPVLVRSGLLETDALEDRDADEDSLLYQYALLPVTALYRVEPSARILSPLRAGSAAELRRAQRAHAVDGGGAWLLLRGTENGARRVARRILADFEAHGHAGTLALGRGFGTVHLFRIDL